MDNGNSKAKSVIAFLVTFIIGLILGYNEIYASSEAFQREYTGALSFIVGSKIWTSGILAGVIWLIVVISCSILIATAFCSTGKKRLISLGSFAVIVALSLTCIFINSNSVNESPINLFDSAVENIDFLNNSHSSTLWKETHNILTKLGLTHYYQDDINEEIINETFVAQYLETHTTAELLEKTLKLYIFLRDESNYSTALLPPDITEEDWHALDKTDCQCQPLSKLLKLALEANNIDIQGIDSSMMGKQGFYTDNPNAEPLAFKESHDGKFYDRDGTNVKIETKVDTGYVTHYGDYAILTVSRYVYNPGYYGWINGEFIDELPSWETHYYSELYYKGTKIQKASSQTELLNSNACVIDIEGTLYGIAEISIDTYRDYGPRVDTHTFLDIYEVALHEAD